MKRVDEIAELRLLVKTLTGRVEALERGLVLTPLGAVPQGYFGQHIQHESLLAQAQRQALPSDEMEAARRDPSPYR